MDEQQHLPRGFRGSWRGYAEYTHRDHQEKLAPQELIHPKGGHKGRKYLNDDDNCLLYVFTTYVKYKRCGT